MKILFVHISDIHCKSNTYHSNIKIRKIADAITAYKEDICKIILICSGDISFSGKKEEFQVAEKLFDNLISEIKSRCEIHDDIEFLIVPGNHDLDMDLLNRDSSEIIKYYSNNKISEKYSDELSALSNYYEFANKYVGSSCDKICETRILSLNEGEYTIQFNIINTAPFSTFKADSKEIHYLPESEFSKLYREDYCDLCITIMHHSTEWFYWDTKEKLENILFRNTDIIFQGHEHISHATQIINEDKNRIFVIKGGEYDIDNAHASQFNIAIFDTDNSTIKEILFDWDYKTPIFKVKKTTDDIDVNVKSSLFLLNEDFEKDFYKDSQDISERFLDYFVFPKLIYVWDERTDKCIVNEEELFNELGQKECIEIQGDKSFGKTSLLRYLYSVSQREGYIPLYLGSDEYGTIKVSKIIKRLFEDQYSREDWDKFSQLPKQNKVLYIDNIERIINDGKKTKLINQLLEQVGHIVYSIKTESTIDAIELAKDKINEEKNIKLKLSRFFKEKRNSLIWKICELKASLTKDEIEEITLIIEKIIQKQTSLFSLSPEFIVSYLKYFLVSGNFKEKKDDIFNKVFETNINSSVIKFTDKNNVDLYLRALEELAYNMHFSRREKISFRDVEEIIDGYNQKYRKSVNPVDFTDSMVNAGILSRSSVEFSIQFSSTNYLAYFVALKMSRIIERDPDNLSDLNYVIKNVCFGINEIILLFLSYIRNNTKFIYLFIREAKSILGDMPELNFEENNISFLRWHREKIFHLPSKDEKKELNEITENQEVRKYNDLIKYRGLYDYDENDVDKTENKYIRARKCISIISKSLISLYGVLESQEIDEIVSCIYTLPNQLLYSMLKPYDENVEYILSELRKFTDELEFKVKISDDDIKQILSIAGTAIVLSLYDDVAFYSSNDRTISYLNDDNYQNYNNQIQKLLMYESIGSSERFVDQAISVLENTDDIYIRELVKLIVNKHLLTHDIVNHTLIDKISAKIYNEGAKKQLLLMNAKKSDS